MSVHILKIIPTLPEYVPSEEKKQQFIEALSAIYPELELSVEISEEIVFADPGEFFESINCSVCGKEIESEIWMGIMNEKYENKFRELTFETPCCSKQISLNELHYVSDAGFAKFQVIIRDVVEKPTDDEIKKLETILGSGIRFVLSMY